MDESLKALHYTKSKNVIQKYAVDPDFEGHRLGIKDNEGWYVYEGTIKKRFHHLADDFDKLIYGTTIYKTLQFFNIPLEQKGEYKDIVAMTLFLDCDLKDEIKKQLKDNEGVRPAELKEVAEKVVKFVYNAFNKLVSPESIELYDSGGGFYCEINHRVTYFISQLNIPPEDKGLIYKELCQRFDKVFLRSVENKIKETIAKYDDYFKFDYLNNNNRQVKCPLSVHKSMPVYVHPIDPHNINFEAEEIPITDTKLFEYSEVIKRPEWETARKDFENLVTILWKEYEGTAEERLKAWAKVKKEEDKRREEHRQAEIQRLKEKHKEIEELEYTSNIQTIFDAVNCISIHELVELLFPSTVRPDGDIRFEPSWRSSDSGTSCFICNEHSIHDLKEKTTLNTIQVTGAHLNLVHPGETPKGEDLWRCIEELRELGFNIPKFKLPKKGRPRKSKTAEDLYDEGKTCIIEDDKGKVKLDIHGLFSEIYFDHKILTISDRCDQVFYWNNQKDRWSNPINHLVEPACQNAWQELCRSHPVNEVINMLIRKTRVLSNDLPELPINFIPIENGLFDIETWELHPHTSEYFYTFKLPVEYIEGADCPEFKQFLTEVQPDQELQTKLQEFMGYLLWRDVKGSKLMEKAFLLAGPGGTGKGTFLNCLEAMLGDENTSNLTLHSIENNRFASSGLENAHANICNDISSNDLMSVAEFLKITSGDNITIERKNQGAYKIKPFCKLIFSCNEAPYSHVDTEAFYERWEIIPFNNKFRGTENERKNLSDNLTTQDELNGMFFFALTGLMRLRKQGLTNPTYGENAMEKFKLAASNVYRFISENYAPCPDAVIEKDVLYGDYQDFCAEHKISPKTKKKFTDEIQKYFKWINTRSKPTLNGKQKHCYSNIKPIGSDPLYPDTKSHDEVDNTLF